MLILVVLIVFMMMLTMILYHSFSWGFVGWKFWYWFILPIFPTLPEITYLSAIGLMLFITLFHNPISQIIKKDYKDNVSSASNIILAPWITLIMGWAIHLIIQ